MAKRRRFPKIFFGWWIVLATGFVNFWGHGFYTQGISAMFKPISAELGLTRAATSVASSIGRFEGGVEGPLTGWITDKFGPKWVILFGCFLIGLGLILMYFVNSLWAFYVVWGGITATGLNVGLAIPIDKTISNWFVKKRGTALGVRAIFQGMATIAVLPFIAWLLGRLDWRMTCVVGGAVMWLVGLPLIWFLVKQKRPEYYGLLPDGATVEAELASDTGRMITRGMEYAAGVQEVEFTLRQAMKTPAYWLLILASAIGNLVTSPIMLHYMPFLTDMGIDPVKAALMLSSAGAIAIPTRLFAGFLADRFKKHQLRFIPMGTYLIIAAGVISFLLNQTITMAYVFLIMFYIGFTAGVPLNTAIRARYFGRKSLGSIQGVTTMIMLPFGVVAPVYVGWIYDTTGSYISAFRLFPVLLAFSAILVLFARPPKPPAQVSDVHKFL